MDKRLRIIAGPDSGNCFNLPGTDRLNVGKNRNHNEIVIHDDTLSRVHCEVEVEDDRVIVTDLDSDGGTFVNGERVTRKELRHGDIIALGETRMCFESIDDTDTQTHEAPIPAAKPKSGSSPSLPATESWPDLAGDLSSLSGRAMGRYELGALAGKGHCGYVFRARDLKENRTVAVKVLQPEFPKNEEETQRFIGAMKTMLPLRHPNLVSLFAVGKTGPYYWIATEFVDGESVAQLLKRAAAETPDWHLAFRLAVHGARALHFAAHHHVIHRNITPANVLIRSTDNLIKINDLIQAKALAGSVLRQLAMRNRVQTETAYLAPEQTLPNPTLDTRSDMYCLGAVVYALLTCRPPFSGKSSGEILALVREAEPAKPKTRQPSMPDQLEKIVLKLLAKRPEERYQTPAELLNQLALISPDPL